MSNEKASQDIGIRSGQGVNVGRVQGHAAVVVSDLSAEHKGLIKVDEVGIPAEGLSKLVRSMREVNDKPLILFQINHSGNASDGEFSKVVSYYPTGDPSVYVLSDDDMEEIMGWFVKAGVISHQVGADGIDFKMCHGYMTQGEQEWYEAWGTRGDTGFSKYCRLFCSLLYWLGFGNRS